jgi:hypothetical protein
MRRATGQIAGAIYGLSGIPELRIKELAERGRKSFIQNKP